MDRRLLFFVSLVVLLGLLFYGTRRDDSSDMRVEPSPLRAPASEPPDVDPEKAAPEGSQTPPKSPPTAATKPADSPVVLKERADLSSLQAQIERERQTLAAYQGNLAALEAQKAQRLSSAPFAAIESNNSRIRDLQDMMRSSQLDARDLELSADNARSDQALAARAARDQLDENIRMLEGSINQTRDQIAFWFNNSYDLTARAENLESLQALLDDQQAAMASLREQRTNLSGDLWAVNRQISGDLEDRKSAMIDDQIALQDQIFDLRGRNLRMEEENAQARSSLMSIDQQIAQTKKIVEDQTKRVDALEQTLRRLSGGNQRAPASAD